ncbi:MAG: enoyl-CoA hydratase [Myxococcota bacterium]
MAEPVLLIEKSEGVATLTLNRPEARNALNRALRDAIRDAFAALREDASVGAVILTGAGAAFCAGLDLKELSQPGADRGGDRPRETAHDIVQAIEGFDRPVIGAINGVAITGGFELALACDVLVGSSQARFADTHARVGILPGWGLSVKLPRLIGVVRAKAVSLTGNFVSAEEAERWGLLARVVPPAELLPSCRALAHDMLSCEPRALSGYKKLIDATLGMSAAEARRHEVQVSSEHMRGVSPGDVASRRLGVVARGREQTRS